MATLCLDTRLNVSAAYLRPGYAFGGSCLPKDLRALNYRSRQLDLSLPVLDNVLASNQRHLQRSIQTIADASGRRIGIFGLAFKEDTDDLRESPVIELLEQLIGKGKELLVYDPHVRIEGIYGANRSYVMDSIPHIGRLMKPSLDEVLVWADLLVIAQKPSAEAKAKLQASGLPIIDLVCAIGATPNQLLC
jgi:GDP-mannose 6-dehydrogenase